MFIPSLIASPSGAAQYVAAVLHPAQLWVIVQRDGAGPARRRLVEGDRGWASVDARQRDHLHPSLHGDGRFDAVDGYGVANHALGPIADWTDPHSTTALRAVFVLAGHALRIYASGLDLTIPYADPSPNWSCFEHTVLGGPRPHLQLVEHLDHPVWQRQ